MLAAHNLRKNDATNIKGDLVPYAYFWDFVYHCLKPTQELAWTPNDFKAYLNKKGKWRLMIYCSILIIRIEGMYFALFTSLIFCGMEVLEVFSQQFTNASYAIVGFDSDD